MSAERLAEVLCRDSHRPTWWVDMACGECRQTAEAVIAAGWVPAEDAETPCAHEAVVRHERALREEITREARLSRESTEKAVQARKAAEREARELRTRVEALADEWYQAAVDGGPRNYAGSLFATAARDLRAALAASDGAQ